MVPLVLVWQAKYGGLVVQAVLGCARARVDELRCAACNDTIYIPVGRNHPEQVTGMRSLGLGMVQ